MATQPEKDISEDVLPFFLEIYLTGIAPPENGKRFVSSTKSAKKKIYKSPSHPDIPSLNNVSSISHLLRSVHSKQEGEVGLANGHEHGRAA